MSAAPHRLPAAPRPYRDETLSSWLERIGCRYGLSGPKLAEAVTGPAETGLFAAAIDDRRAALSTLRSWARAAAVDPGRLVRLQLDRRFPDRADPWLLPARRAGVCLACFVDDRQQGREAHLRALWRCAECCICSRHRRLLVELCPACQARLEPIFLWRDDRAAPSCRRCGCILDAGGGEGGSTAEGAATASVLHLLQHAIARRIAIGRAAALESLVADLWAPLDDLGAVRPVLAICFDVGGWRCPVSDRHIVGMAAPLAALPLGFRIATLLLVAALAGADLRDLDDQTPWTTYVRSRAAHQSSRRRRCTVDSAKRTTCMPPSHLQPTGAGFRRYAAGLHQR